MMKSEDTNTRKIT